MNQLQEIIQQFDTQGSIISIEPYGSGHIHDTYKVETKEAECDDYILQGLNNEVFKNIEQLQHNICLVTEHIAGKLKSTGTQGLKRRVLTVVKCRDGKSWYRDESGKYWRVYIFISRHKSYDIVESLSHATEGGKAIGLFQSQLADLDSKLLYETIPWFHDIEKRLSYFNCSLCKDEAGRVSTVSREIAFVRQRAEDMSLILKLGKKGLIPSRITHNDTKFNNILLDENNKALCVIDLDTVMAGYVHYDFGDAIRTTATRSAEDETDLAKVELDIELFRAYTDGYLSQACSFLTDTEISYLAFAPRLITFTIGLRFLTDYIEGDRYFKIHRPDHNLDRARTQFKLIESNEEKYEEMQKIINLLAAKYKTS